MLAPFQTAVVDAIAAQSGERVLDVGCGYGTTTLAIAEHVGALGSVHGVDISPTMIDAAWGRAAARTTFAVADVQTDSLAPPSGGRYDAAISRFGVMFFAEPEVAFANIASAIRAGGRMAFVCWQTMAQNDFFMLSGRRLRAALPDPPPIAAPHAPSPFALADIDRTRQLLEGAGWSAIDAEPIHPTIHFHSSEDLDGVETAMSMIRNSELGDLAVRQLTSDQLDAALDETEADVRSRIVDGVVSLSSAAWIVTAQR